MKSFAKGFTAYEAVGRAGLRAFAPTQVQSQSRVCFPPCDTENSHYALAGAGLWQWCDQ